MISKLVTNQPINTETVTITVPKQNFVLPELIIMIIIIIIIIIIID